MKKLWLMSMVLIILCQHALGQGFFNVKVNTDATTQVQNEQQIIINPLDSLNFVCDWRDFRVGYRQVGHAATFDGGRTWVAETLFVEPTYNWDSDPGMTVDASGNFFAIILSFNSTSQPNGLYVLESTNKGLTWSTPRTVINGVSNVFEDKELIACDRTTSPYRGYLYVAWARFINFSTPAVYFTRSTNKGFNWSTPIQISDTQGSLQWPVPAVGINGEVYVAWVTNNSIRFDRSTNGGTTWDTDRTVQSVASMNRYLKGGQILTFSYPAIDADITGGPYNGYIYIAYMDNGPDGYPDLFFTRSTNGGQTWSTKVRINDDTPGNQIDQFHPWLTVDRTGCISVIFYDSRNDPSNILCDLYLTQSTDGGITWSPNERVSTVSFDLRLFDRGIEPYDPTKPLAGQRAGWIGEYNGIAASSRNNVVPIWTDTRNGNQDTYVGNRIGVGIKETSTKMFNKLLVTPNPATNNCLISLEITHPDNIELVLYNACGRQIENIFKGLLSSGLHQFKLNNLSHLPTGVYFINIKGTNFIESNKFILLQR